MSYSDYDDHNDREPRPKVESMHYFNEVSNEADTLMSSSFFRMTNQWMTQKSGLDLKHVVFGVCLLAASRTYSTKALEWLEENGTNTVEINCNEVLARDLQLWVAQQSSNQQALRFLSALPSFQNLKWQQIDRNGNSTRNSWGNYNSGPSDAEEGRGYNDYEFAASVGRSFFFFQGKIFAFENTGNHLNMRLRCFWGNAKPLQALIRHVKISAKSRTNVLEVHMIRGNDKPEVVTNKRRTLNSIDITPRVKQELLSELQDFFDPETEHWCFENGAPYRRGYMFYGPPGTGKSSLCTAIASEFNLPIYYIHLSGMDDESLQKAFQSFPKRCLVLFEEIDTAGIVRHIQTKDEAPISDDDTDSDSDDDSDGDSGSGSERKGKGKKSDSSKKSQKKKKKDAGKAAKGAKVTLGGLLNVLDGPGAKEGRLVVFTTNSPNSLDEALIRPGRIDRRIYLGRSTKLVASITFTRIFGTDPRLKGKVKKQQIDRMAKEFGDLIPSKRFTPCEIQSYCMTWRGNPEGAIRELPNWIEEQLSGKQGFKYDITKNPAGSDDDSDDGNEGWDEYRSQEKPEELFNESSSSSAAGDAEIPDTEYKLNLETMELEKTVVKSQDQTSEYPEGSESHSLWSAFPPPSSTVHPSELEHESPSTTPSEGPMYSAPSSPSGSKMFQRFNNLSHPDFDGLRNTYPYGEPLDDDGNWSDDGRTILLKNVDPIPLPDTLVLDHSGGLELEDPIEEPVEANPSEEEKKDSPGEDEETAGPSPFELAAFFLGLL